MGRTLYLGSLKSDVYFCIYEKDYEQYVKLGTPWKKPTLSTVLKYGFAMNEPIMRYEIY